MKSLSFRNTICYLLGGMLLLPAVAFSYGNQYFYAIEGTKPISDNKDFFKKEFTDEGLGIFIELPYRRGVERSRGKEVAEEWQYFQGYFKVNPPDKEEFDFDLIIHEFSIENVETKQKYTVEYRKTKMHAVLLPGESPEYFELKPETKMRMKRTRSEKKYYQGDNSFIYRFPKPDKKAKKLLLKLRASIVLNSDRVIELDEMIKLVWKKDVPNFFETIP